MWRGRPAISRVSSRKASQRGPACAAGHAVELLGDAGCVPAVGDAREPLELAEREAERLADVADRAAAAVGGEAGDERGVLAAVALGDGDDQLLADVAREVEVDVGDGRELVVQEAAERKVRRDRVDMREAGEVADDRADRRAASSTGREDMPGRARPAHLECTRARELEHFPMEQEEAGEPEPGDQRQFFVEPLSRPAFVPVRVGVPLGERAVADRAQLAVGRIGTVGEVRVAIAELLCQVERAAVGYLACALCSIVRKALLHLRRREQHRFLVAAPLALGAVERGAVANRDEHVLQPRAAKVMCMHVAGRNRRHVERRGELGQPRIAPNVASPVRSLKLDVKRPRKRARQARGTLRVGDSQAMTCAAREADDPFRVRHDDVERRLRRQQLALAPGHARSRVDVGEDPAQVGVAALAFAKQRHVCAAGERHLRAGDRAQPELLACVRELERAVDAVVVGERERVVAELGRPRRELLRQRRPVEERVGRVRVQLDIRPRAPPPPPTPPPPPQPPGGPGGSGGGLAARPARFRQICANPTAPAGEPARKTPRRSRPPRAPRNAETAPYLALRPPRGGRKGWGMPRTAGTRGAGGPGDGLESGGSAPAREPTPPGGGGGPPCSVGRASVGGRGGRPRRRTRPLARPRGGLRRRLANRA